MYGELVSIPTPSQPLDGMFYEPVDRPARGVVQLLHGHDTLSTRNRRNPEGNALQTVAEAVEDNRLAREWLARELVADGRGGRRSSIRWRSSRSGRKTASRGLSWTG